MTTLHDFNKKFDELKRVPVNGTYLRIKEIQEIIAKFDKNVSVETIVKCQTHLIGALLHFLSLHNSIDHDMSGGKAFFWPLL